MISKELLSEVLGLNITSRKKVAQASIVRYNFKTTEETRDSSINIYELQYLCKEWALNQGYWISSWLATDLQARAEIEDMETDKIIDRYTGTSEPEAVFKATQYIYDNLSNS